MPLILSEDQVIEDYGGEGETVADESRESRALSLSNASVVLLILLIISMPLWAPLVLGVKQPLAIVEGRSMEPILHTGDLVVLRKVPPDEIHVGDIIIYKSSTGRYVIHRVVYIYEGRGEECYVTWGDNRHTNPIPDTGYPLKCPPVMVKDPLTGRMVRATGVPYSMVLGKVISFNDSVFKIPYIGGFSLLFK